MRVLRALPRVVAAATLAAAAYAGLPAAPAAATGCAGADGVTVVIDFHELGGGVQTACVPAGGGDDVAALVGAAGFDLAYVQRTPGFVCRVAGKPADDPCVTTPPADAYWGLFWSDGTSGTWSYATTGAGSLHVPDGGYAAFSWQGSSARTLPGYRPAPHPSPTPTPTEDVGPSPTGAPAHPPAPTPTQPTPSPTGSTAASPASSPTSSEAAAKGPGAADRGRRDRLQASANPVPESSSPAESPSNDAVPTAADPSDPAGGLPAWVAPVVVIVLLGAAGGVAVVRRRRETA